MRYRRCDVVESRSNTFSPDGFARHYANLSERRLQVCGRWNVGRSSEKLQFFEGTESGQL